MEAAIQQRSNLGKDGMMGSSGYRSQGQRFRPSADENNLDGGVRQSLGSNMEGAAAAEQ